MFTQMSKNKFHDGISMRDNINDFEEYGLHAVSDAPKYNNIETIYKSVGYIRFYLTTKSIEIPENNVLINKVLGNTP